MEINFDNFISKIKKYIIKFKEKQKMGNIIDKKFKDKENINKNKNNNISKTKEINIKERNLNQGKNEKYGDDFENSFIDIKKNYKKIQYKEKINSKYIIGDISNFIINSLNLVSLLCQFCLIFSNNQKHKFTLNSYEVLLKVDGIGIKRILNDNFKCPSNIYINEISINFDNTNCRITNISESESEIILEWNNGINTNALNQMFSNCYDIKEIDMTNFDTTGIIEMKQMFQNCYSLKSLNISNFKTQNVKSMIAMFSGCSNLTSIDLSSFDTRSLEGMTHKFKDCKSLTSINLSNFKTGKVGDMFGLFENDILLTSIDLSNFDTSQARSLFNLFKGCSNLEYINLKNFEEKQSSLVNPNNMFEGISDNAFIDIDSSKCPKIYNAIPSDKCIVSALDDNNWRNIQKKWS